MKTLHPDDLGYWLFTQGSNLYLLNNELPCGTAKTLGRIAGNANRRMEKSSIVACG